MKLAPNLYSMRNVYNRQKKRKEKVFVVVIKLSNLR